MRWNAPSEKWQMHNLQKTKQRNDWRLLDEAFSDFINNHFIIYLVCQKSTTNGL